MNNMDVEMLPVFVTVLRYCISSYNKCFFGLQSTTSLGLVSCKIEASFYLRVCNIFRVWPLI